MQLEHQFTVPVPVAQAWDVLLDVERIAPCMPGATVESFDGETIVGRVKVKVGPIQVTYAGTARFSEKDEPARRAVIEASAKEARGSGTANATITAQLHDDGGSSTNVTVTTDLAITGKPAQFGRGVMVEVGNKLLGRFADCLAGELGSGQVGAPAPVPAPSPEVASGPSSDGSAAAPAGQQAPAAAAAVAAATTGTSTRQARPAASPTPIRRADNDAIDLLDTAGIPVLKRLAPLLAGLVVLVVVWRLVARRR
jgi:carbon monoxide dehydrogenase subunit G